IHTAVNQIRAHASAYRGSLDEASSIPLQTQILLGSSGSNTWPLYETYASEITRLRAAANPGDTRPVVLGIALKDASCSGLLGLEEEPSPETLRRQKAVVDAIVSCVKCCAGW
ncbi:hypothetical protein EV182_004076, partial [Spiromyces aspiralis]